MQKPHLFSKTIVSIVKRGINQRWKQLVLVHRNDLPIRIWQTLSVFFPLSSMMICQLGALVVTTPRLDASGQSLVVTLAHAIFDLQSSSSSSRASARVLGVSAVDVRYEQFSGVIDRVVQVYCVVSANRLFLCQLRRRQTVSWRERATVLSARRRGALRHRTQRLCRQYGSLTFTSVCCFCLFWFGCFSFDRKHDLAVGESFVRYQPSVARRLYDAGYLTLGAVSDYVSGQDKEREIAC